MVLKRRLLNLRRRGNTQKKTYDIKRTYVWMCQIEENFNFLTC